MKHQSKSRARIRLGEKDFRILTHPDTIQKRIAKLNSRKAVLKAKYDNVKARITELENLE